MDLDKLCFLLCESERDPLDTSDIFMLRIDATKCQGHNRCFALAPELVDVDEFGQALVRGDGWVPAEKRQKAALLVANCPEFAIELIAPQDMEAK